MGVSNLILDPALFSAVVATASCSKAALVAAASMFLHLPYRCGSMKHDMEYACEWLHYEHR